MKFNLLNAIVILMVIKGGCIRTEYGYVNKKIKVILIVLKKVFTSLLGINFSNLFFKT